MIYTATFTEHDSEHLLKNTMQMPKCLNTKNKEKILEKIHKDK